MKILNKIALGFVLAGTVGLNGLFAHTLWVNSFEAMAHKPGHAIVSIGWGHTLPIDDILNSPTNKLQFDTYKITAPDGSVTDFKKPTQKLDKASKQTNDFDLFEGDVGLQKVKLKKESQKGVYTIDVATKPTIFTRYIDTKNRMRLKLTTLDKIDNVKRVIRSIRHQANAKTYLSVGKWSEQKATNKGLEIIPKTDLSKLKVGDMVKFEVLYNGKPLQVSTNANEYIKASAPSFGQNEGYAIMSLVRKGKAGFRIPSSGQWIVSYNHTQKVDKEGPLKDLYKKINHVVYTSSLTFHVK